MKTNRTPFTDVCKLLRIVESRDENGYVSQSEELGEEIFCSISQGTIISEFYEAQKAGIRLSGMAEIWEEEYNREQLLEYEGRRFNIVRVHPTGHGTVELTLEEVVH